MLLRLVFFLFWLFPFSAITNEAVSSNSGSCEQVYDSTLNRSYYKYVDEQPSYKGGTDSLLRTLREHIRYPQIDRDTYFNGTIWISFIVEANGTISNIRLLKKSTVPYYNEEAVRVAGYLTAWNPGKCNGQAVATQQYLPVRFMMP